MSAIHPTDDPLPWITERMRRSGVFITQPTYEQYGDYFMDTDKEGKPVWRRPTREKQHMTNSAAQALLDILTQAVSALHDDAKAYTVVLSKSAATAGTLLEKRVVEVGSKPMNDNDLTEGQKASVMAGLALHEVGHIRFARQYRAAITRLFGADKVTGAISTLSNLAADLHDEAAACAVFPGLAPSVAVTLWWVGDKGNLDGSDIDQMLTVGAIGRVNAAIKATRYPWTVSWDSPTAQAWLDWWSDWAVRAAAAGQPKDHALIVQEAIEKVREGGAVEEPPDGPGPCPIGPKGPQPDGPKGDEPTGNGGSDEPPTEDPDKPGDGGSNGPTTDDEPKGEGEGKSDEKGDETNPGGSYDGDESVPPTDDGSEAGEGDDKPGSSDKGSTDGTGKSYDEDESGRTIDTCVKGAAENGYEDQRLQGQVERLNKGKREGMRRRVYKHSTSVHGQYGGRTVVSIPHKGKRLVWDV